MYSAANGLLLVVSVGPISRRGGAYCIMKCAIFWAKINGFLSQNKIFSDFEEK